MAQTPPIQGFVRDIPAAGTRVRVSPDGNNLICGAARIQAATTNTGNIFVGGPDVSSSVYGAALAPGASVDLPPMSGPNPYNLKEVWLDTATNGNDAAILVLIL